MLVRLLHFHSARFLRGRLVHDKVLTQFVHELDWRCKQKTTSGLFLTPAPKKKLLLFSCHGCPLVVSDQSSWMNQFVALPSLDNNTLLFLGCHIFISYATVCNTAPKSKYLWGTGCCHYLKKSHKNRRCKHFHTWSEVLISYCALAGVWFWRM